MKIDHFSAAALTLRRKQEGTQTPSLDTVFKPDGRVPQVFSCGDSVSWCFAIVLAVRPSPHSSTLDPKIAWTPGWSTLARISGSLSIRRDLLRTARASVKQSKYPTVITTFLELGRLMGDNDRNQISHHHSEVKKNEQRDMSLNKTKYIYMYNYRSIGYQNLKPSLDEWCNRENNPKQPQWSKRTTETVNLIRIWANRAGKTQFHAQNDNTNTLLAFGLKTDHNDGMQNEDEQIKLSFYHYRKTRLMILVFWKLWLYSLLFPILYFVELSYFHQFDLRFRRWIFYLVFVSTVLSC